MTGRMLILIALGTMLSIASVFTSKRGLGELYPFFHYKLYSAPDGRDGKASTLRVYIGDKSSFRRVPVMRDKPYDQDEFIYQLSALLEDTAADREVAKQKMKIFLSFLFPGQTHFRVVRETYPVRSYLQGDTSSSKEILLEIQ